MTMIYSSSLSRAREPGALAESRAGATDSSASEPLRRLQQTMHAEIPLTRAIGICAVAYDHTGLELGAPLAPNINDKGTVFSGSLNAAITLAGWGLIWLLVQEQHLGGTIVIQDSEIKYLQPVRQDFVARAQMPEHSEIEQFRTMLHRRKLARLSIRADIWENDAQCVAFTGRYVVDLKSPR
jgi:thioesterase domain-containing protein